MNLFNENTEGVFLDVPAQVYHDAPGFSHSMAKAMHPTPAHLLAYMTETREPSADQIIGTLVHARILEPDKPLPKIVVPPEKYPAPADCSAVKQKKAQPGDLLPWHGSANYCKAWAREQRKAGNIILTQAEFDTVNGCVESIARHPRCREIFACGQSEVSAFKRFAETRGGLLKARLDFVPVGNTLVDVKTCQDASLDGFSKTVLDNRYYSQAAWYLDIWNDLVGNTEKQCFAIVAVEKRKPYCVAVYNVVPKAIGLGRKLNKQDLDTYVTCSLLNQWPGYSEQITDLDLPQYAYKERPIF